MAYEQSAASRAAEASQQQRDAAMRAATSLTSWCERFGHRIDQDLTAAVLDVAAQLRRKDGGHGG